MHKEVSVIICAFNEEKSIKDATIGVLEALKRRVDDFEVIIVNDGSIDKTGSIADELASAYPGVKVCHHPVNRGFGEAIKTGLAAATKKYVSLFPGDNEVSAETIGHLVDEMGKADIILSYHHGDQKRARTRVALSRTAVWFFNWFFGLKGVRYFNGPFLYKAEDMRVLPMLSSGIAILPECSIHLLKRGCTYREVPMIALGRVGGKSTTIRWKYYKENIRWILHLKRELRQRRRKR